MTAFSGRGQRGHGEGRALVIVFMFAGGCMSSPAAGNGALGREDFSYICESIDSTGGEPSPPSPDAWCDTRGAEAIQASPMPDIAVGAAFRIRANGTDQSSPVVLLPAVPALAQQTSSGWALVQPGWLGFVAWSGSDVVDFMHLRASAIAGLAWESDPATASIRVEDRAVPLAVLPEDVSRATLAGAIACVFTVSDPGVLRVSGTGRVAMVTGLAEGTATLAASCMGLRIESSLHVFAADRPLGDASSDASTLGEARDAHDADDDPERMVAEGQTSDAGF